MKAASAAMAVLVSGFAISLALGASGGPARPPGIDAQHWIIVSDKMGFVVTTPATYPPVAPAQALLVTPPAEGYFMIHVGNSWQRIIINDPIKGPGASG
jgi:hypothetical protein